MRSIHQLLAWVVVGVDGLVGVWGLVLAARRRHPPRPFRVGVGVAVVATLAEVAIGVYLVAVVGAGGGDQHVFYGIVVAFTLAFAYLYRAQLARRPAVSYGLLMMFVAGLCLRAMGTYGLDF